MFDKEHENSDLEIKVSDIEKQLYDQKLTQDRLIDKYQREILAFESLTVPPPQAHGDLEQISILTHDLASRDELLSHQSLLLASKESELTKLIDIVQELNDNLEFLENENDNLRINLADMESDNKQLLDKNFRTSII